MDMRRQYILHGDIAKQRNGLPELLHGVLEIGNGSLTTVENLEPVLFNRKVGAFTHEVSDPGGPCIAESEAALGGRRHSALKSRHRRVHLVQYVDINRQITNYILDKGTRPVIF